MYTHNYDFRNRDFQYTPRLTPTPNAAEKAPCRMDEDWEIIAPVSHGDADSAAVRLTRYFTGDLVRFLTDAFGVCLRLRRVDDVTPWLNTPHKKIILVQEEAIMPSPLTSDMAGAFHITVTEDSILIVGKTERGTAQGVYYLEDCMKLRGECALPLEKAEHAPLFSPRMTHSGVELDTFPDNFLEACAHSGMDAIIVYAGHPDTNLHGFTDPEGLWPGSGRQYCDFANLVWRAAGYGLDVYVYSHILCDMHPDEPDAPAYYEASFGKLFRTCPGIKGIIFVGETFEFPSKDPHTSGIRIQKKPKDEHRVSPGWYPCEDYPRLVTLVRDTIRRYNPQADLIFWTYNWGYVNKDARLALIDALPRDISLLVTFDMWETFIGKNGQPYRIDDYSISFAGPSCVFVDEAERAKELGIRLYTMCNTGGRTWDNGSSPYLPVPQQWQKRYEALCQSHEKYGLAGLMEDHHFGWLPSFLTLLSKNAFMTNGLPGDEMLCRIARRDWGSQWEKAVEAWRLCSEGITQVVAANIDQYGPYRSGPTYPLLYNQQQSDLQIPKVEWAMHGGFAIWFPVYADAVLPDPAKTLLRYSHVQFVTDCFRRGLALLEEALQVLDAPYGSEISRQTANVRYIYCTYITTCHVIGWTIAKKLLKATLAGEDIPAAGELYETIGVTDRTIGGLAQYMRDTAAEETENVALALTCWEEDSSIGFEPSMEYVFNPDFAAWKNSETRRSLEQMEDEIRSKK